MRALCSKKTKPTLFSPQTLKTCILCSNLYIWESQNTNIATQHILSIIILSIQKQNTNNSFGHHQKVPYLMNDCRRRRRFSPPRHPSRLRAPPAIHTSHVQVLAFRVNFKQTEFGKANSAQPTARWAKLRARASRELFCKFCLFLRAQTINQSSFVRWYDSSNDTSNMLMKGKKQNCV